MIYPENFYVYAIFRETGVPFYIGKGKGKRWKEHEWDAQNGKRGHRFNIIRSMQSRGIEIIKAKIHENLTEAVAHEYEMALIAAIGRGDSGPLVNLTDGGDGVTGLLHTHETRMKLSLAQRGKKASQEARNNMSAAGMGRKFSLETRAKIAASSKGRPISPEMRIKLANANRGKKASPETRAKISAAQRGKKLSPERIAALKARVISPEDRRKRAAAALGKRHSIETKLKISIAKTNPSQETRAKISAAGMGRKPSEKARLNMSAARTGKKHSPEARINMSIAAKLRCARFNSPETQGTLFL